ncbi:MAG: adenylyl-sulfate kinase [Nitrosomonas sp.]|nr:adenylyl-sulfate kinase [Nitrosomonas sp.]
MSKNISWHHSVVTREKRNAQNKHNSAVLWFTGLSGSGKSTLAHAVEEKLFEIGCQTVVLDGDNVRHGLCADLDFTIHDRTENIRRIGETAKLFVESGIITLTAFISPFSSDRDKVHQLLLPGDFLEIYCQCDLNSCEQRDVKGHYRRARAGEIKEFTGISSPYEAPKNPALVLHTDRDSIEDCVQSVMILLQQKSIIPAD